MEIKRKIKGSSVVEVMVAMVIVTLVFSISSMIYLNIQKTVPTLTVLKTIEVSKQYLAETLNKKLFFDESITVEDFEITRTISRDEIYRDCLVIRVTARQNSKPITSITTTVHENQ